MAFVAIYTVGRLKHSEGHPASRDFFEVGNEVMREAARTGALVKEFSPNRVRFPENETKGEGAPILTLTVWKTLHALHQFTYSNLHKEALQNRHKWFGPPKERQPNYVVWWSEKVTDVSWKEAFKRYDYYLRHGPGPYAFDFKHAFDAFGNQTLIR